jgi:hypothetical protein
MTKYTTRKTNAGFEFQVCKIGSNNYARIMLGDKIAAKFYSAPLAVGLRAAYAAFEAFDFSDILTSASKQSELASLISCQKVGYAA